MKYNRLELLLLQDEFYDKDFQPLQDKGVYVVDSTTFCIYGKRWSAKALHELTGDIVNHRVQVETIHEHYGKNPYDYFEDFTIHNNFIQFDYIFIPRGDEHLYLTHEEDCKVISFGTLENKKVLSVAETKKMITGSIETRRVNELTNIATWTYDPNDFFNGLAIFSFSAEHFKNKTADGIKSEFKRLAKKHHPDAGGEKLMFQALTRAKEYLLGNLSGKHTAPKKLH